MANTTVAPQTSNLSIQEFKPAIHTQLSVWPVQPIGNLQQRLYIRRAPQFQGQNARLDIQLCSGQDPNEFLLAKYGLQRYEGSRYATVDVEIPPQVKEKIQHLQEVVIDDLWRNSKQLFGKDYTEEQVRSMFCSCIRDNGLLRLKIGEDSKAHLLKEGQVTNNVEFEKTLFPGSRLCPRINPTPVWNYEGKIGFGLVISHVLISQHIPASSEPTFANF